MQRVSPDSATSIFPGLKRGSEVMVCENCQRILYYNPPVKVEDY